MWYYYLIFPLFIKLNFFLLFIKFKLNFYKNTIINYNFFDSIICNCIILKLNNDFNANFIVCIDCLINYFELLPISYKFYFRYRNKRYVELFSLKVIFFRKNKIYFKILNESLLFLFKIYNYTLNNLAININLKHLFYYNRFILNRANNYLSFYYSIKLPINYNSKNLLIYLTRIKLLYINFFKNV